MTALSEVLGDPQYIQVLDKGFCGLKDVMGNDSAIVEAARTSYGKGTKSVSEDRGLIRYLMRHRHTSVFEMVEFKFHLKMPIFVMRQHVRHRTANLNEYSGRYSIMTDEFYIPDFDRLQAQSTNNKQGSGSLLEGVEAEIAMNTIKRVSSEAYSDYLSLINEQGGRAYNDIENRQGMARELARVILPLNNYTECYWKIDLKNLLYYIGLRKDPHAQYEIRVLAEALAEHVKRVCPIAYEAFEDYMEHSVMISRLEKNLLQDMIKSSNESGIGLAECYHLMKQSADNLAVMYGMSKRELTEFETQWRLV